MNSRDLGATLTLAWPDARVGVMGARQAVGIVASPRASPTGADPLDLADRLRGRAPAGRAVAAEAGHVDEVVAPAPHAARVAASLEAWR